MNPPNRRIFGTDGVRGTANIEPITADTVLKLGCAAAHVFKNLQQTPRGRGKHQIVVGKDTRLSGYLLENAVSAGILSMGVDVLFIGPLPTPGIAYVTRSLRADAGIAITASHNPYDDNGVKFFRSDGYKLDDDIEARIENLVFSGEIEKIRPRASAIGKAVRIDDALGRYIEHAKNTFPRGMTLEGLRIVVDCGNGAAYKATPTVLRELGAEVFAFGVHPNGTNINLDCGSMHPETMCQKVWEHRAHVGIAHDGDADRVLLCDEHGRLIDGDDIMAVAGLDLLRAGQLPGNTVVATVMSNAGLEAALQEAGGHLIRTPVGDKHVIDEMLTHGYSLGGEQSGHMIFGDHSTTGDGLVTALQILRILQSTGKPLSELVQCWTRFPQIVTNVKVREKRPFEELDHVLDLVREAETEVHQAGGRVLLRYSGTEPKARLLIEGRDPHTIESWSRKITDCIRRQLGA
ncbi:MAG: phosphoglucosamine mutase [Verrucomicrobiae bacterium]|nr:phosphoglucosamine mutase [Verrucomicrobiae bacterium]